MFKVIMSNIDIAITPSRIARLHSNLVQSFITSQATHYNMFKVKGQRLRSHCQRSRSHRKL